MESVNGEDASRDWRTRVEIPTLKLYFIGSNRDNTLRLTPAIDDPRFGFAAGKAMSATSVILAVQPFANSYNGLPQ